MHSGRHEADDGIEFFQVSFQPAPVHEINNFLHPGWVHVEPHWAGLLVEFVCAVETTFWQAKSSEKAFFCFLGESPCPCFQSQIAWFRSHHHLLGLNRDFE